VSEENIRIAIGGLSQETNTFSPVRTGLEDFKFVRGEAILAEGLDQPWRSQGIELLPTFVAWAEPCGPVRKGAYAQLKEDLLREFAGTLPLDGVYLDLHGAMEIEDIGDGEGDLIRSVRELVGRDVLISVSLDLHGNVSPALVGEADIVTAYRTAPHRDCEGTRRRALGYLVQALREGLKPVSVMIKPPLLLTGEEAMTDVDPARSLYARLEEIERVPGIVDASLLIGFAWADTPYTAVSVIVVAERDQDLAHQHAVRFAREVWARRHDFGFGVEVASVDESIRRALDAPERPVFISDAGDNVTAGGGGDVPLFVERLLAVGAEDALVAGLSDAEAVRQCVEAGEGAAVRLSIGGKLDPVHGRPLEVTGLVERLSIGPGVPSRLPTTALVRVGGVRVILTMDRRPLLDRISIQAAGVDLMQQKIVVVKQGYLFPDLSDFAPRAIIAFSSGAVNFHLAELPYRNLLRPIFPIDPDVAWDPL